MTGPVKSASILWVAVVLACGPALAQSEAPACALHEPDAPHLRGLGTVIGIQDPARANSDIQLRQARRGGAIDPHYLNDQRAVVRQDTGVVDVFDVPVGVEVHAGDRVALQGSYRSADLPCSYIPILIRVGGAPTS